MTLNAFELLKWLEKYENPIALAVAVIFIGFLLWRKFGTSEYVTAGKEVMEQYKNINTVLQKENETLKTELDQARKIITDQAREIEELHEHKTD